MQKSELQQELEGRLSPIDGLQCIAIDERIESQSESVRHLGWGLLARDILAPISEVRDNEEVTEWHLQGVRKNLSQAIDRFWGKFNVLQERSMNESFCIRVDSRIADLFDGEERGEWDERFGEGSGFGGEIGVETQEEEPVSLTV